MTENLHFYGDGIRAIYTFYCQFINVKK